MPIKAKSRRRKQARAPKNKAQPSQAKELTRLGSALRALGGLGGGFAGSLLGNSAYGSQVGTSLGASLSRFLGSGDYTVSSNSIVSSSLKGSSTIPNMHRTDQTITVRHREFLSVVKSSTSYTVSNSYEINPGLSKTFPWLSTLASSFQEYTIKGLVYHYIPTSGMIAGTTNTSLGSVMIQTAYRASDTAPTTKYELLNEYWANECMPSEAMVHPLECKKSETVLGMRYIRTGSVTDDVMFYDYGKTTIATQGQQTTGQTIGDLWVTYEVELKKPRMHSSLGRSVLSARWVSATTAAAFFWSGAAIQFNSFAGIPVVTSPVSQVHTVTIPAGNAGAFTLSVQMQATGCTISGSPLLSGTNATAITVVGNNNVFFFSNSSTTFGTMYFAFRVTDPTLDATMELSGLTTSFSGTASVTFVLNQIDSDATSA